MIVGDRGAELIELALILPFLLIVFAAIIDFGFLFQRWEVLTNAAREGARVGILPGYVEADIDNRVIQYLAAAGISAVPDDCDVLISTIPLDPASPPGGKMIQIVTVTVERPADFLNLGPMLSLIGGAAHGTIMLRGVSTMRTEEQ